MDKILVALVGSVNFSHYAEAFMRVTWAHNIADFCEGGLGSDRPTKYAKDNSNIHICWVINFQNTTEYVDHSMIQIHFFVPN